MDLIAAALLKVPVVWTWAHFLYCGNGSFERRCTGARSELNRCPRLMPVQAFVPLNTGTHHHPALISNWMKLTCYNPRTSFLIVTLPDCRCLTHPEWRQLNRVSVNQQVVMRLAETPQLALLLALISRAAGLDIPMAGMNCMTQIKVALSECCFQGRFSGFNGMNMSQMLIFYEFLPGIKSLHLKHSCSGATEDMWRCDNDLLLMFLKRYCLLIANGITRGVYFSHSV